MNQKSSFREVPLFVSRVMTANSERLPSLLEVPTGAMPVVNIRGVNIFYRVIGESGPWMALVTGGRRSHEEFVPLSEKIAQRGFRVLLHDRRNTGASDILIEGDEPEESLWIDDLHVLMSSLGGLPAFIAGSSAGARMAMRKLRADSVLHYDEIKLYRPDVLKHQASYYDGDNQVG